MKPVHKGINRLKSVLIAGIALDAILAAPQASAAVRSMPSIYSGIEINDQTILGGSSCSKYRDDMSVMRTSEGQILAVQLNSFSLIGSGRLSCVFRTAISIPSGFKAVITLQEPNGAADLSFGDTLSIAGSITVDGRSSLLLQRQIQGPANVDFGSYDSVFESRLRRESACAQTDFRGLMGFNLSESLMSRNHSGQVYATDVSVGVQIVPCH